MPERISMLTIESLPDVPDDFFPDHPEGLRFYRLFGRANVDGFKLGCLVVRRDDRVISTVPYFVMRFALNTMLPEGMMKRLLAGVSLRIACVGHPSADIGRIAGEASAEVLACVNRELAKHAPLVCYKGFGPDLPLPRFARVSGLPVPALAVSPRYWSTLGTRKRSDLKRKLKFSTRLRFEEYDGLPGQYVDRVIELYLNTYRRAAVTFERLNRAYFVETAPISKYLLFFEGNLLIGFAQTLCGNGKMIHKYVGMDYERNRRYRLYFALYLRAIDICIRDGLTLLDSGVTAYDFKCYLGSEMHDTWLYYQHQSPLLNALLKHLGFLLEPGAAELR